MTDTAPASPEKHAFEIVEYPHPGRWESLGQAFTAHHFPQENLPLVQRLMDAIGVTGYEAIPSGGYIRAARRSGGPTLYINYGYTFGLKSEAEVLETVGDVAREEGQNGQWYVIHPVNKLRDANRTPSESAGREYGVCEVHGMELPASGICDFC